MMEISELIKKLKIAKYKIDKMILYIEDFGEFEVEPQYIGSVVLEKDYDNYNFPFFELFVTVPNKVFRAMRKKNIQITAYIRMKYTVVKRDTPASEMSTTGEKPPEYLEFAKNFYVYGLDGTPSLDESQDEAIEKAIGEEKTEGTNLNHASTAYLLLYDLDMLDKVKVMTNEIITSGTLTDILTRVLNQARFKKVLLSPATNGKVYHEFTLLPIRTDEQIERICKDYAIHENGTRIFYDFDMVYIINKKMTCTAWKSGEYKQTYLIYNPTPVKSSEDAELKTMGTYEDPDEEINYCTMTNCSLQTSNVFADQSYGTSYLELDSKTGAIRTAESDSLTANNEKSQISKVLTVNRGEASSINEMTTSLDNTNVMIECAIDNTRIDFLTMNKEFHLIFNDDKLKRYNGIYTLRKFITAFNKTDGEWFTTNTVATFTGKKIE